MLRILLVLLAVGAAVAVECPGTWQSRAASPLEGIHQAVTLADGRVLAVGGYDGRGASAIYDPTANVWSATSTLPLLPVPGLDESEEIERDPDLPPDTLPIVPESLTLLPDGSVIGIANTGTYWAQNPGDVRPTEQARVAALHWSAGGWSVGGTIANSRFLFAAARLGDNRIVAVGGADEANGNPGSRAIIYDASSRTWSHSGGDFPGPGLYPAPRQGMTATRLADGRVLATGGVEYPGTAGHAETFIIAVDGTWTPSGPMTVGRVSHIAALLPDGRVLAAGGTGTGSGSATDDNSAEIFDPATGTWAATQAAPVSVRQSATLSDGRVLALGVGGGAYVFEPRSATWCTTTTPPTSSLALAPTPDGALIAVAGPATYRFTFDDEPTTPGAGTLDITEVRWAIEVEADTVRVGGALAAEAAGDRWEAITALPGAGDNTVTIQWTTGTVTRTATASANEVIVPLGGG